MIALIDESSSNFLSSLDYRLGGKNYAVQVHHANAVAEAAESSLVAAGVQRQINQENTASTKRKNAPPPIRTQSRVWERRSGIEKV